MSDTIASLSRKISSAGDLQSVVRTMKALAASSIGQYERSVSALSDYYRVVELGLGSCFRKRNLSALTPERKVDSDAGAVGAIVFGSDQGLVGQFNDVIADYATKTLSALPGKLEVWAVGERVQRAPGGRGPASGRPVHRAEFRQRYHPARRADSRGERSASQPHGGSPSSTFFTIAPLPERGTRRPVIDCCHWTIWESQVGRASLANEELARGHG
jgi:hypothetical protein